MPELDKKPAENTEAATDSGKKPLSAAAKRALAEAEERRKAEAVVEKSRELHGRGGLDPARYGDWEIKGLTSDF